MLGFGEIFVPPNCKAVVSGRIEERTRFYLGRHEPIYFVNLASQFVDISAQARSTEGIIHSINMKVKLSIEPGSIAEVVKSQGYSNRHRLRTITVDDLRKQHSIDDTIKAIGAAYVHKTGFMDLIKADLVFKVLQDSIQKAGAKALLRAEDFTCEVTHIAPDPDLRAHIAAAGFIAVAEYFQKRDAEPEIARANVKIVAADQEDRVKEHQEGLAVKDTKRQEAMQDRNKNLKDRVANYDFEYKKKRLEDERKLATEQLLNAESKDKEEATVRERKRLDMQLDLEREEGQAKIRAQEKAALSTHLEALLAKAATMPAPDYSNVHTLVTDGNSSLNNVLLTLLTNALGVSAPEEIERRKSAGA